MGMGLDREAFPTIQADLVAALVAALQASQENLQEAIQFEEDTSPHALRIRYPNRDKDWQRDETTVYRDGFDESSAENFFSLDAPGITDTDQSYRFGRFHLSQILFQREAWIAGVKAIMLVNSSAIAKAEGRGKEE